MFITCEHPHHSAQVLQGGCLNTNPKKSLCLYSGEIWETKLLIRCTNLVSAVAWVVYFPETFKGTSFKKKTMGMSVINLVCMLVKRILSPRCTTL